MTKVFISYNHQQGPWVLERLTPCLEAGGAEVLIDRQRFAVGQPVVGQMDAWQDQADRHLLILSPEYLNSRYCRHEMNRALQRIKAQPDCVIPVLRHPCNLPKAFSGWNPLLYADLCDDRQADPWAKVLQQCDADLGTTAPAWLTVRDNVAHYLQRNQSVNLVVDGDVRWRELLEHIHSDHCPALVAVNLERGAAASRRAFLTEILRALGMPFNLPPKPEDLVEFERSLLAGQGVVQVALTHFDYAAHRHAEYGVDLFGSLRALMMDERKLVLLVQSRAPFRTLLPPNHLFSKIDIKTVMLRERP